MRPAGTPARRVLKPGGASGNARTSSGPSTMGLPMPPRPGVGGGPWGFSCAGAAAAAKSSRIVVLNTWALYLHDGVGKRRHPCRVSQPDRRKYTATASARWLTQSVPRGWAACGKDGEDGYGQARVRNEPVAGRLRRPYGVRARPHAVPPLHRGGSGQAGSVYGRTMYEIMRYWDDDQPEWDADEHAFAAAWRNQPKWVVSRSLTSVGPNARLVGDDLEGAIRALKAERDGEIEVAGPDLAQSLTALA